METMWFLKVGHDPARGPLSATAIIEGMRSGVLPAGALVGPTADGPFELARDALAPKRANATGGRVVVGVAGVLLVAVLGGALALYLRTRPPKLCDATPKLVASLTRQMEITAYVTRGSPKLDGFVVELERLLAAYKAAGQGRIDVRLVEAVTEEQKLAAKEAGLTQEPFGEVEESRVDVRAGYMGLAFKYGAEKDAIKSLAPDHAEVLEFWITNKMRELRARADAASYKIGVVVGRGAMSLSEPNLVTRSTGTPSLRQLLTQNFPFYSFVDVDLARDVDSDLRGLVVTQPESDFTQADLERIDAFVMKGRALAVFASAVNVKAGDATMRASLSTHGLERLLAGYGITMHRDVVLDLPRGYEVKATTAAGQETLHFPFVPVVRAKDDGALDAQSVIFFQILDVAFPFASSLALDKTKQPGATFRALARTSAQAVVSTEDPANLNPMQKGAPSGPGAAATVAASVEGKMTSAFTQGSSAGESRVLVVASSQFLANPFARASNAPADAAKDMMVPTGDEALAQLATPYAQDELTSMILAFKNTLDWLAMDDDLAKCALTWKKEGDTKSAR